MTKTTNNGKKLKIALLGCGKMGQHHIKAIQMLDSAEIVAVADVKPDIEKLKMIFNKMPGIFSDPEELLKAVRPDVVHITTPPATHFELAKLALTYGANIYVEKPFVLKKVEAEEILKLAKEKNLRACPGHQVLFEDPAIKTIHALNEIGQIVHLESYFSFRTVRRNITPVDQLIDILPHPVYLLLHFLSLGSRSDRGFMIEALDVNANGEVRSIIKSDDATGILIVTLKGRPVESYLRIVGMNGSLYADFVRGVVIKLAGPGASAIPIVLSPFKQAKQLVWKSTKAFAGLALKKQKSYPGLAELIGAFYSSIISGTSAPIDPESIIQTVGICETVTEKLRESEAEAEKTAEVNLRKRAHELPELTKGRKGVLVTGGTGFLGRKAAAELRAAGWPVRVAARRTPPFSMQIPGIEYAEADLSENVPQDLLKGIEIIVHCAAETGGGKTAHEINSIGTTRNIMEAAVLGGVKKFIHISSVAVLKPNRRNGVPLDEGSPVDLDNENRGPYVWGKAQSEHMAAIMGKRHEINVKIIRLGPLVDFEAFQAPGRLGREIGNTFVAVGSPDSEISLCKVQTAAEAIRRYVDNFDNSPAVLNLIEPTPLKRGQLTELLLQDRPDLRIKWLPYFVLKTISPALMLLQRIVFPKKKPIDIHAAFSAEKYKTDLASKVLHE